ncbi:hypothetical protein MPSEU_000719900 [Mayamaea pseudoterrestris]|nr:hypothetical protein MPSEU_000719900 [Mayamaea pseudoterrestris]
MIQLTVECSCEQMQVNDPREVATILQCSLRELYGDFDSYGCSRIQVLNSSERSEIGCFLVTCPEESEQAVRAALTWITPPPYLDSNIYRFDVVGHTSIESELA